MAYEKQIERGETHLRDDEWAAKTVLCKLGLRPSEIPRENCRTADFLVDGDSPGYVVEAKARLLNEAQLAPGTHTVEKGFDNKVYNWLFDARQQCHCVDPEHERLWFVWASAEGPIAFEIQATRIFHSLYGIRYARDASLPPREFRLYYADRYAFEDFKEIDAVVISVDAGNHVVPKLGICPNEDSPRFRAVRRSKLVRKLRKMAIPFSVPRDCAKSEGCALPKTIDRKDERAVLAHARNALDSGPLKFVPVKMTYRELGSPIFKNP